MNDFFCYVEVNVYCQQGFGMLLLLYGNFGLLIVDFVVGFVDFVIFGGGNIVLVIVCIMYVLVFVCECGWLVVYSCIVYVDDGSDDNVFLLKVFGMVMLIEYYLNSVIVFEFMFVLGEFVVCKIVLFVFFGM